MRQPPSQANTTYAELTAQRAGGGLARERIRPAGQDGPDVRQRTGRDPWPR